MGNPAGNCTSGEENTISVAANLESDNGLVREDSSQMKLVQKLLPTNFETPVSLKMGLSLPCLTMADHKNNVLKAVMVQVYRLKECKMGFYHTGLEIFGKEFTFCTDFGIISHMPKKCEFGDYLGTIQVGEVAITEDQLDDILIGMKVDGFTGDNYDVMKRCCNTFTEELTDRLGLLENFPAAIHSQTRWAENLAPFINALDMVLYKSQQFSRTEVHEHSTGAETPPLDDSGNCSLAVTPTPSSPRNCSLAVTPTPSTCGSPLRGLKRSLSNLLRRPSVYKPEDDKLEVETPRIQDVPSLLIPIQNLLSPLSSSTPTPQPSSLLVPSSQSASSSLLVPSSQPTSMLSRSQPTSLLNIAQSSKTSPRRKSFTSLISCMDDNNEISTCPRMDTPYGRLLTLPPNPGSSFQKMRRRSAVTPISDSSRNELFDLFLKDSKTGI